MSDTYKGMTYLKNKLNTLKADVKEKYLYYSSNDNTPTNSQVIPASIRSAYISKIDWCARAVDALADRLIFREFKHDDFNVTEIFNANNSDIFFDGAIQSALIGSCCFVYIAPNGVDLPKLQIIEAARATGVIDPTTNLLEEGYAVLKADDYENPLIEAYFTKEKTEFYYKGKRKPETILNPTGHCLLVPIIHRPDAIRPFGRSRISKASMYWHSAAKRTLERAEITADFYSFPQKYVLGLDDTAEPLEQWQATISTMLTFTESDSGNKPSVGQFQASSMTPFIDNLKMLAAGFAGSSGLTLDDMGFPSEQPSSVEAIKAAHENLRAAARKAQRSFASGFLNVAYVAACLRDEIKYERQAFGKLEIKWLPLFEADSSTLNIIGDGAIKLNQAIPDYLTPDIVYDLTGIGGAKNNGKDSDRLSTLFNKGDINGVPKGDKEQSESAETS